MDDRQRKELSRMTEDDVRFSCPMSRYTTFGVGGDAEALYEAGELNALQKVMAYLWKESIPYMVLGGGSNLVVRDGGIKGVVILLRGSLAGVEKDITDADGLIAGAGLSIVGLLNHCRDRGLGGLEFLAGIPGSVGGAVAMNAGAWGMETGTFLRQIMLMGPGGNLFEMNRAEILFSYRNFHMEKGSVIVQARFGLRREGRKDVSERIALYLRRRKQTQPLEYPSAGSVFKNPPDDHAGRLIDEAGLKGTRVGGAMISEKHANFIVNTGGATAEDILDLMRLARDRVKAETGIQLEPEIRIVGE